MNFALSLVLLLATVTLEAKLDQPVRVAYYPLPDHFLYNLRFLHLSDLFFQVDTLFEKNCILRCIDMFDTDLFLKFVLSLRFWTSRPEFRLYLLRMDLLRMDFASGRELFLSIEQESPSLVLEFIERSRSVFCPKAFQQWLSVNILFIDYEIVVKYLWGWIALIFWGIFWVRLIRWDKIIMHLI